MKTKFYWNLVLLCLQNISCNNNINLFIKVGKLGITGQYQYWGDSRKYIYPKTIVDILVQKEFFAYYIST